MNFKDYTKINLYELKTDLSSPEVDTAALFLHISWSLNNMVYSFTVDKKLLEIR